MKKLLTLFAVLALTAPVFAAEGDPNVLVTCEDEGSGVVAVSYQLLDEDGSNPGLANLMRGIALDITVDGGATIDAISDYLTGATPADSSQIPQGGYPIFMGSIQFAVDPNLVSNYDDPVAPNTDPDALGGLGTAGITVEMGSLYPEGGTAPGASGLLFKMTVSGATNVTIAANTTRGSCVAEDGTPLNVVSAGCEVGSQECMAATHPDYNEWVNNGIVSKPKCWCFEYQCRGDVLGDQEFGQFWVFQNDLAVFRAAFGQNPMPDPAAGICADFAHDIEFAQFRVFQNDLAIFRIYFGQNPIPSCSGPGSGNDENPLPNSEFNFWETP